jgi:hypothetical protein
VVGTTYTKHDQPQFSPNYKIHLWVTHSLAPKMWLLSCNDMTLFKFPYILTRRWIAQCSINCNFAFGFQPLYWPARVMLLLNICCKASPSKRCCV